MKHSVPLPMIFVLLLAAGCKNSASVPPLDPPPPVFSASVSSQENRLLIGACYYPWYRPNAHWSGQNLRQNLDPAQPPELGSYDCMDQAVISQHVRWSMQAGIDFWISSWWGVNSAVDNVIREGHLQNPDFVGQMGYCLLYEPVQGTPLIVDDGYINRFLSDLTELTASHFSKPNYLKIDQKPVLYVYLTRTMQGDYARLFQRADSLLQSRGYAGLYVVGDEVYWGQTSEARMQYMEAVTAYNPHVSDSWVADPVDFVTRSCRDLYGPWMATVNSRQKSFWIDVIPGFNDMGVRPEFLHPVIPRGESTTFGAFLRGVKPVLKSQAVPLKVLVVTSFNEWHEDTQIEPTIAAAVPTQKPTTLTRGNWYYGYGTQCLDTLAAFKAHFWD